MNLQPFVMLNISTIELQPQSEIMIGLFVFSGNRNCNFSEFFLFGKNRLNFPKYPKIRKFPIFFGKKGYVVGVSDVSEPLYQVSGPPTYVLQTYDVIMM